MIDTLAATFREEASEVLSELETSLLDLNDTPDNMELIDRIFRALHTIKGSGGMAGLSDVAAFAHEVETIFVGVRSGEIAVTTELINLTLQSCDQLKKMIETTGSVLKKHLSKVDGLVSALRLLSSSLEPTDPAESAQEVVPHQRDEDMATYRIRFQLTPDIFAHGVNPLYLLRELKQLGDCQVVAQVEAIPDLEAFDAESCYLWWDVILTTNQGRNAIEDVFIFVSDSCQLQIEVVEAEWIERSDDKRLGEILMERGDISSADLLAVLAEHKKIGEILVARKLASAGEIAAALIEQDQVKSQREARLNREALNSVRVKSEKLDALVNLIGELVTVQARLSQIAGSAELADLMTVSEEVERLTWDLRDQVLTIRMLPIGATFNKFKRLVHDLSQELGKNLQIVTDGAETELDKTVIERLNDPLMHLIRNAVDHGIEAPEVRRQKHKPEVGTVWLSAAHVGASVIIVVRDDGQGIDRTAVRRKAESVGLLAPGAEISDRDLLRLTLAPGFSTAREVTEVSGRGVGMDVVKRAIDALRGELEITSKAGEGTTFTIKLPLTLAIIDGLLVQIGVENYILPLSAVVECLELRSSQTVGSSRNIVNVRDKIIPYVRLRDEFSVAGEPPEIEQVVIADIGGDQLGFVVDTVIGEHQTVIKNLGSLYHDVKGISGATILGDGRVALILDPPALQQLALTRERDAIDNVDA
ncbi:MAG: chemotaxis protein CheA [Desulfuromonadales bacterium]|nr:chemotaxis protein CheA [Desulfuromonadales bacterium]